MAPSILITGCGRSGTTYVSKLLCEAGLDLLHHDVGPDGSVDWCLAVTSDVPLPWGKKGRSSGDYVFDRVLHQLRAPLAVISSSMTIKDRSWDYISNFTSINPEDSAIKKSMLYWLEWNRLAEAKADFTYRVEQIDESPTWNALCSVLERPELVEQHEFLIQAIASDTNTRRDDYAPLTWDDLRNEDEALTVKIAELADHYGYSE